MYPHKSIDHLKLHNKLKPITTKSQLTALEILKREDLKSKKSRLESLLSQQFIKKYGTKQENSKINVSIKTTVNDFFKSVSDMNEAEEKVNLLEIKVKSLVDNIKSNTNITDKNSNNNNTVQFSNNYIQNESTNKFNNNANTSIDSSDWLMLNAILDVSNEEVHNKRTQEAIQRNRKYREDLDKHVELLNQQKELSKIEKAKWSEVMNNNLLKLKEDEENNNKKRLNDILMDKEIKLSQIKTKQDLLLELRNEKLENEKREIEKARKLIELDELNKLNKKLEQKRRQDEIIKENILNNQIKELQLQQQRDYENKLNREYEEKLKREEEMRIKAFQARLDALNKSALKYESLAGKEIKQKEQLEADRTQAAVDLKEKLDLERERLKEENRRLDIEKSKQFNQKLLDNKKLQSEQQRQHELLIRERLDKEALELKNREKLLDMQRKKQMLLVKSKLDEQINQQKEFKKVDKSITEVELSLNKSLIRKVQEDPVLLKKVMDRVHPVVTYHSDGFKYA